MSRVSKMQATITSAITCDRCGQRETRKLPDVDVSATEENLYLLTGEVEKALSEPWARVILVHSTASEKKPEGRDLCAPCFAAVVEAVAPTEMHAARLAHEAESAAVEKAPVGPSNG